MAIAVTPNYQYQDTALTGQFVHYARLDVTGLVSGNNTVPHGLTDGKGNAIKPLQVGIEPTSNQNFWEYQAADTTNIYIGAGSLAGGGTTISIYVTY